ncbi:hypothetical protein VTN96DRAFT_8591 [Rasamsonia emersonii]
MENHKFFRVDLSSGSSFRSLRSLRPLWSAIKSAIAWTGLLARKKMQLRSRKRTVGFDITAKSSRKPTRSTRSTTPTDRVSKPLSKTNTAQLRNAVSRPVDNSTSSANETKGRRECIICTSIKLTRRKQPCFPKLDSCAHEPLTCSECIVQHITITLQIREAVVLSAGTKGRRRSRRTTTTTTTRSPNMKKLREAVWLLCSCPQCGARLTKEDLFPKLSPDGRKQLDQLIRRKAAESHPRWVWCISPTCSSGHIHQPRKETPAPQVTCKACGHQELFLSPTALARGVHMH